jgi:hypothetical protein
MANKIMISCKQATYLISKQQETTLKFRDKIKLAIHTSICSVCRLFKIQSNYIIDALKSNKNPASTLSIETKEKIETNVKELIQSDK